MKNITIIVLSTALVLDLIFSLTLYRKHINTKDALIIANETKLAELNEKITQLTGTKGDDGLGEGIGVGNGRNPRLLFGPLLKLLV